MNTLIKILTFLIIFVNICFAQNFFPLKVGNIYQVKDHWWWAVGNTGESGTYYYSTSIERDTLINGQIFFGILNYNAPYTPPFDQDYLFRYDSLSQQLLVRIPDDTLTRLAVDFTIPAESTFVSFIQGGGENYTSEGFSSIVVLGDTHIVYTMKDNILPRHTYKFGDNIGFIYYEVYDANINSASFSGHDVISAIIDSIIYNPLILKIDSLYPAFDRPVDTFPYLMTIPYTASYSALVDSFYLYVEHIRSDTLVQTKKNNLSKSNPSHLTFYLDSLKVGDKIKLRATITDTSIYKNVAHYPDTGWVVMNVLSPILSLEDDNFPLTYNLDQNFPNPFNPKTRIRYQVPEAAFVTLKVYDVLGNEVETLINEEQIIGTHEIDFDGSGLTSGIYYYRITANDFSQTKKMILLK
jgi:hypothetical protein